MATRKPVYARTHSVLVNLHFDKPITATAAVSAARNHIHGDFGASIAEEIEGGWSKGRIKSVQRVAVAPRGPRAR